ncbi:MAG: hypothetical protein ABIH48_02895 [Candidatus Falkowbacteria bacterium]
MRKSIVLTALISLLIIPVFTIATALAATNNFIADANITITGFTVGDASVDLFIFDESTCEEWTFSDGILTITNSGSAFKVGCSSESVGSLYSALNGTMVDCVDNTAPGTTYLTMPTTTGSYTAGPLASDCTAFCTSLDNVATYNAYPTCGALTCNSGYSLSGSGASAVCVGSSGNTTLYSGGGGGGGASRTVTTTEPTTTETTTETVTTEAPVTTTTELAAGEPDKDRHGNITLGQMTSDAETVISGDVSKVIAEMGVARNSAQEAEYNDTIVAKVVADSGITAQVRNTIVNFVTYGTRATKILGAGERGGVVNSYRAAFGKLPTTANEWNDVVKIANGRWPSETSATAEERANINFRAIYLRDADRTNAHDDAAITVMTYGLRPANRNLDSEKTAIKTFEAIYGYAPVKATAWDVVRAIAYSGATR